MKGTMIAYLIETGEMEKLKNLLKTRLIESGWRDEMKAECKRILEEKKKNNHSKEVTVDELVKEMTPIGRGKVDKEVKEELLKTISSVLKSAKSESAKYV